MINPLSVATGGYITYLTKKRLAVSVDGYLIEDGFTGGSIGGIKGGAGFPGLSGFNTSNAFNKFNYKRQEDELMIVLKAWFHIQNF